METKYLNIEDIRKENQEIERQIKEARKIRADLNRLDAERNRIKLQAAELLKHIDEGENTMENEIITASDYYTKDSAGNRTPITDENVFTHCPECGIEFNIDLVELISDMHGGFDLYGTSCFCPECSARRHASR